MAPQNLKAMYTSNTDIVYLGPLLGTGLAGSQLVNKAKGTCLALASSLNDGRDEAYTKVTVLTSSHSRQPNRPCWSNAT